MAESNENGKTEGGGHLLYNRQTPRHEVRCARGCHAGNTALMNRTDCSEKQWGSQRKHYERGQERGWAALALRFQRVRDGRWEIAL